MVFSLFLILHRAFYHFLYPTFCQFRKRKMVQSWFQKVFWNQDCDVVGNLVVEIEILNFSLFVCLLVCLYLTFCQFRKRKMVQSWFQKLFWNQDCDVVSNLVVEIAIYNFDLFHYTLFGGGPFFYMVRIGSAFRHGSSARRSWSMGIIDQSTLPSSRLERKNKIQNIAKGTTDPRVEFISQVITQILIKQFRNFNWALTSKHHYLG